jgi:hypothetical protein
MATITIEIPNEQAKKLGRTLEAQARFALEATVLEAYRQGLMPQTMCGHVLAISRAEFVEMVSERQIAHPLTTKDLVDGYHAVGKHRSE